MNRLAIFHLVEQLRRVRSVTFVTLLTLLFASPVCIAQTLQKGVSVELPLASSAVSMPDADNEDALIVSVTEDGSVYFGINPTAPSSLTEKITEVLSARTDKRLYMKIDRRTPYAKVAPVLDSVRMSRVESVIFLTTQLQQGKPKTPLSPKGLEVALRPPIPSDSDLPIVQIYPGLRYPALKVNNENIIWAALKDKLTQLLQNRSEKVVLVKTDGTLLFAPVVQAIDMSHSSGATIVLVPQASGQQ